MLSCKLGEHSDKSDIGRQLLSMFREDFQPNFPFSEVPHSWEHPRGPDSVAMRGAGSWRTGGRVGPTESEG